jgi:diguanylate cyclase (GGDEF)-like protein
MVDNSMPLTYFFEGLEVYFAPMVALIVFGVVVLRNTLAPRMMRRLFFAETLLIFTLILASWFDKTLSGFGDDGLAYHFHRATTFINFAFSPITSIIASLIYRKKGLNKRDMVFLFPEVANIALCIASIFTGWIFYIDTANVYSRGAVFYLPFIINAIYAGFVVFYSTKQVNKADQKLETYSVLLLFACIFAGVIIQLTLQLRFMIWSIAVFALLFYYVILCCELVIYDQLTGALSRDGFRLSFQNKKAKEGVIAMIDMNGLKETNDRLGHDKGDQALYHLAQIVLQSRPKHSWLYHYGGDEFVFVAHGCDVKAIQVMLAKCEIDAGALTEPVSFAYGVVALGKGDDLYSRLQEADKAMYEMKRGMKGGSGNPSTSVADI